MGFAIAAFYAWSLLINYEHYIRDKEAAAAANKHCGEDAEQSRWKGEFGIMRLFFT